jgi:hypothetical protein
MEQGEFSPCFFVKYKGKQYLSVVKRKRNTTSYSAVDKLHNYIHLKRKITF